MQTQAMVQAWPERRLGSHTVSAVVAQAEV